MTKSKLLAVMYTIINKQKRFFSSLYNSPRAGGVV